MDLVTPGDGPNTTTTIFQHQVGNTWNVIESNVDVRDRLLRRHFKWEWARFGQCSRRRCSRSSSNGRSVVNLIILHHIFIVPIRKI